MKKIGLLLPFFFAAIACQSRFEEKQGAIEKAENKSKVEIEATNKNIAEKILKAKEVIDALGYAIDQVSLGNRKLNSSTLVMGLIFEASSVAHVKNMQSGKYAADGEVNLPLGLTSPECRMVKIHSEYSQSDTVAEQKIFVQTCKTNGGFSELISILGKDDGTVSILSNHDYSSVLPNTDAGDFLSAQNCAVVKDGKNLQEVTCKAADLKFNSEEKVVFNDISFKSSRDPLFRMEADLLKNGQRVNSYLIEIGSDGKVFSKVISEAN